MSSLYIINVSCYFSSKLVAKLTCGWSVLDLLSFACLFAHISLYPFLCVC